MPVLTKARWERFAQHRAAGLSQAEAYRAAGYTGRCARTGGWRVEQQAGVKERVAELQQGEIMDRGWVLEACYVIFHAARKDRAYMAAMRAAETVGKVVGCFNDNRVPENNNVIRVYSATPLTEEEWAQIYIPKEHKSAG
jgi:hypothetical protein